MTVLQLLLLLGIALSMVNTANILVMMPFPWYSHTNSFMPIFRGLAAKGHNVTMVSPFRQKKPIANFNEIMFPYLHQELVELAGNLVKQDGIWFDLCGLWHIGINWLVAILEQDFMKQLIEDDNKDTKYDLIIIETWFMQEALLAFGHKYNAPVVSVAARVFEPQGAYLTGNDLPPSYVPVPKVPFTDHMNFLERVQNTFYYYWNIIAGELYYMPQQEVLMRKYFKYPGSENLPPLTDMVRNTSLTLMDSTFTLGYPAPFHKNIIEFGGIHLKESEKLPADLQKFMDSAEDGVVYFSFGSHVELALLEPEEQKTIISALGKLKQKVLMKIEATNPLINTTKPNILVRQWFPQPSILAHPNCKVFITHGGLHGSMEGVYHKVPMLAIPLMTDQKINAKFLEHVGVGNKLYLKDITEQKIIQAVKKLLEGASYKENLEKRSAIFKDQPIDILENAIYWIEYVIRHKGAPHLRPAALDLYWYQRLTLDVIAFYLLVIFLIIYLIKSLITVIFKTIKRIIYRGEKSKTKKD